MHDSYTPIRCLAHACPSTARTPVFVDVVCEYFFIMSISLCNQVDTTRKDRRDNQEPTFARSPLDYGRPFEFCDPAALGEHRDGTIRRAVVSRPCAALNCACRIGLRHAQDRRSV